MVVAQVIEDGQIKFSAQGDLVFCGVHTEGEKMNFFSCGDDEAIRATDLLTGIISGYIQVMNSLFEEKLDKERLTDLINLAQEMAWDKVDKKPDLRVKPKHFKKSIPLPQLKGKHREHKHKA